MSLFDVFGMIPPPGNDDGPEVHERYAEIVDGRSQGIGGDAYYGYLNDLRSHVERTLEEFGVDTETVELVQGLYEETLHPAGQVAVAHVDCDWFESVRVCIERIWPRLSPGGVMIFDDYDAWDGCTKAVDLFLEEAGGEAETRRRARLQVVRVR